MADIRINALATTAASTASDDFVAVDGSANGTRKLDAYSPTFGGNLTVSGTGTTGGNLRVRNALGYATGIHTGTTSDSTQQLLLSSNAAYNHAYISKGSTTLGIGFSSDNGSFVADDSITITAATKLVTLTGNLTVSGTGTSSFAGNVAVTGTGTNYTAIDTGSFAKFGNDQTSANLQVGSKSGVGAILQGAAGGSVSYPLVAQPYGGNVLIGTTTDGGQKLQVAGVVNSSGAGYTNSGYQITNTTASRTTGWFQSNSGTTILRDVTGTADLLSVDLSGNATFAGNVTVNGVGNNTIKGDLLFGSGAWPTANYGRAADRVTISSSAGGPVLGLGDMQTGVAANRGATIYLFARGTDGTNDIAGASFISKRENATSGNFASTVEIGVSTASISNPQTRVTIADATTTFANAIAIGNTVQTAAGVSSTHKVTISIGGSTYYLLATNV